jgi:acyl-CoA thioester hydrolase
MEKNPKQTVKVRFQDCDPFNHLNNSSYIDYFMNTREDQVLEHYQIDIYQHLKQTGQAWVVASNQIIYLKPAMMNEKVIITSQLIKHTNKSLLVEMQMWDENQTHLKSIFWSKFVYFSVKTQQSVQHSDEFMELFSKITVPVEQNSFEERCQFILQNLKEKAKETMKMGI